MARRTQLLEAVAAAGVLGAVFAPGAAATDSYPCGAQRTVAWTTEKAHSCQLVGLTASGAPLYTTPVANPAGQQPPPPAAWVSGPGPADFVCERQYPNATFHHPSNWHNNWWAYTRASDGRTWGWVSEAYFRGGANNEPDGGWDNLEAGLRTCPPPPWPTSAPAPPGPTPPPSEPAPSPVPPPTEPPQEEDKCATTPVAPDVRLAVSVRSGTRRRSATFVKADYGRSLNVHGRLTRSDGSPIAGAEVCVAGQRAVAGAGVQPAPPVVTDARGFFWYRLGSGPSRRIWFVYRTGGAAATGTVVIRVRAPVTLRPSRSALRTGDSVELRGALGWDLPGALVELQARRGSRWQTFATTRVDKETRYRLIYRFTRTVGVQRYQLRARVPAQPTLPFTSGASRPVALRVSG